ncbi:MAG: hypothetical protein IJO79_03140 [Firmicutes bacterium]|nr:hypothetical protein [Bacillota bacterium]
MLTMETLEILKLVFLGLLCVPVLCVCIFFLNKLFDEVMKKPQHKKSR